VIQDAQWHCRADGAETRFFLTAQGHAESLRPPTRYPPTDVEPGGAVPLEGADAVLRHLAQHSLVEVFIHLSAGDLAHLPRTIPSSLLSACPCCEARLVLGNSQRAGWTAGLESSRWVENLPLALQSYVGRMEIGGGLTKEAVAKATTERSADFAKWVLTTDEIRSYPFDPDVKSLA